MVAISSARRTVNRPMSGRSDDWYSEADALGDIIPYQMASALSLSVLAVAYMLCTAVPTGPRIQSCSFFFVFSYVMACYTTIMIMVLAIDMLTLPVLFSLIKMNRN